MNTKQVALNTEFVSGQEVEPGLYVDVETGALIRMQQRDSLPDGTRTVSYNRRFVRLDDEKCQSLCGAR